MSIFGREWRHIPQRRPFLNNDNIVVGLDIGSTKVCAVIGEWDNKTGKLEISGVGIHPSTGIKKGVVVNIEATLRAVEAAVGDAEMMSGRTVHGAWVGIGGSHVSGIPSRGAVAVRKTRESRTNAEAREIGREDIERVLKIAREVMIPMDREILEVIPQSYIVDGLRGIKDPMDMIGVRLEAEVHIITCGVTGAQNLIKCVNRAGFRVSGLILQSLAAGRSVLLPEEKDLGTALIDLGGGTTDVLVYQEGAPYSTITIPAGGVNVTNDISVIRKISLEYAEKIKLEAGCCWEPYLDVAGEVLIPGVGGRPPQPIPKSEILGIIKPRMEQIFWMVKEKLEKLDLPQHLGAGIVISGGASQMPGTAELAAHIFDCPVRIGIPRLEAGLPKEYQTPAYSTAVGLALEGFEREGKLGAAGTAHAPDPVKSSIWEKLKIWLEKEFF
ncbi:MAG: cell division protein FtsA [Treponema sp.]|nr:cell division protein FtsA [Treponema sp.]